MAITLSPFDAIPCDNVWFNDTYEKNTTAFDGNFDDLKKICCDLQQEAKLLFIKKEQSTAQGAQEIQYEQKISSSGTASDRVAIALIHIRRCPLVYTNDLFSLLSLMFKHKRSVSLTAEALFEALQLILPQTRCLIPMQLRFTSKNNQIQIYENKLSLLYAYLEDQVAVFVQQLTEHISTHLQNDPIQHLREMSVEIMSQLLHYPTTGKMALKFILTKFEDSDRKIVNLACQLLGKNISDDVDILIETVLQVIQQIQLTAIRAYKPIASNTILNQQQRKVIDDDKRYLRTLLTFVKQFLISMSLSPKLFADLADLYFSLIAQQLELDNNLKIKSQIKFKKQKKVKIDVDRVKAEEFSILKLLVSSLTGILPKSDFSKIQKFEEHILSISRFSRQVQFSTAVQMNELLIKVLNTVNISQEQSLKQDIVERLTQTVVESVYITCFRFDFQFVSEQSGFYSHLQNIINLHKIPTNNIMFKKDIFASFWKKLLQAGIYNYNPAFINNVVLALQTASIINSNVTNNVIESERKMKPSLCLPFRSPLSIQDGDQDSSKFSMFCLNPSQTRAENDQLYEMLLMKRSYHPSSSLFASSLFNDKFVVTCDLKEIKEKTSSSRKHVRHPFNLMDISSFIKGNKTLLVHNKEFFYNQIHLQQIHNLLQNQAKRDRKKVSGGIDEIIIADMIKNGILQENAQFQEVQQLLENDPEYMSKFKQTQLQLTQEQVNAMDFGGDDSSCEEEEGQYEEEEYNNIAKICEDESSDEQIMLKDDYLSKMSNSKKL